MKKIFILFILLALPITIYIIFATAVHHFSYLPVLTENVGSLDGFETDSDEDRVEFEDKVNVLCFFGSDVKGKRGHAFNLHDRVYKKNYIYKDFQVVIVVEKGFEKEAEELKKELYEFANSNMLKWNYIYGSEKDIQNLYNSLQTDLELDDKNATPFAFLIDKEGNLRGRKDEEGAENQYGYVTESIAALNNTLVEDVSILLAEYRLKENKEKNTILKKDIQE